MLYFICSVYRNELCSSLKAFWLHVAKTDQMHFTMLPLLFHLEGCFQPHERLTKGVFSVTDKEELLKIAKKYLIIVWWYIIFDV